MNKIRKFWGVFLIFLAMMIFVVYADSNGIWHNAGDVKPGLFGQDQVTDFSSPPFYQFNYLFIGMIYDIDNTSYYLDPSSNTKLNNLTLNNLSLNKGNVIHNCIVSTNTNYSLLSCSVGFKAQSMVFNESGLGDWNLQCCKYN